MLNKLKTLALTLPMACMLMTAPAQARCWSQTEVSAAKVRDLETMLMVSALRCRNVDSNILSHYNKFINRSRPALIEVNETLRHHFVAAVGAKRSLNAYDNYVTSLANQYGAGVDGLSCDQLDSITKTAMKNGESVASLVELADRVGASPKLRGGQCVILALRGR